MKEALVLELGMVRAEQRKETTEAFQEQPLRFFRRVPGRRLVDCESGKHITLAQLFEIVASGGQIMINDVDGSTDVTGDTLLRVLIEARNRGQLNCLNSCMYVTILHHLIYEIYFSALGETPESLAAGYI